MFTSDQLHTAKKIMFTILAVSMLGAGTMILLTYSPHDSSWSYLSTETTQPTNMGGYAGAWLADVLYSFIGWSAWWLLVMLAYEAVCLWWERSRVFWLLRLLGYAFLLLASSGLLSTVGLLVQSGWMAAANQSGTATTALGTDTSQGGILGLELTRYLSAAMHTLPMLVVAAFFLVFFLVTLTYVFDIRWRLMLNALFTGVMGTPTTSPQSRDVSSEGEPADNSTTANEHDAYDVDDIHNTSTEQLPLAFDDQPTGSEGNEAATNTQPNDDIPDVLGEFLVNANITAEHLDDFDDVAGVSDANSAHIQPPTSAAYEPSTTAVNSSFDQPQHQPGDDHAASERTIIEPVVNGQAATSQAANTIDKTTAPTDHSAQTTADLPKRSLNIVTTDSADEISFDTNAPPTQAMASSVDPQPTSAAASVPAVSALLKQAKTLEPDAIQTQQQVPNDTPSVETSPLKPLSTAGTYDTDESNDLDMTPSNTPPSNPSDPPQASTDSGSTNVSAIQFARPTDEVTDHIEQMVPDDLTSDTTTTDQHPVDTDNKADRDAVVLAAIDDDEAFKTHSRAMQTARYRDSLTPIPELAILDKPDPDRKPSYTAAELTQLSELLEIKLQDFNVKAAVINAIPGPVVTRFEVELAPGIKASKVTGISRDLARSLSMASLRVVEVIPGKPYIGIEVPNKKREMVRLIELLETSKYKDPKAQISMAMGKDIGGNPIITDLAKAPHMLVAGTTGSGKSVLVNSMLLSMLLKYTPDELRLILIDPKQLELANYNDIPHLLTPVVTDMNEAASSLSWCVAEMERRYQLMSLLRVRKLGEFNKKVQAADKAGQPIIDPLWRPSGEVGIDKAPKLKTLPMIVIVADEFADMIMQVGKQAEELITRLAQKSRAAGIHLMLATQRPSVDVITGLIKANIPARAALRVNSKVDSRTILDAGGAEDMLGNGDMLFLGPGQIEPDRVHGAFVSDEEVNRVCEAWRERGAPDYIDNMADNFALESPSGSGGNTSGEDDDLYDQAVAFIMETRKVSASSIQRKFSIGYNRAARIVDSMEEAGLVSSMGKSGKRELLM